MNGMNPVQRVDPLPSRREFNKMLARMGLGMVMIPVVARRSQAAADINYFTWAGYEIPEFQGAFIEKYGAPAGSTFFGNQDEALQKMMAGFTPDIAHPCNSNLIRWRDAGVVQPIDVSRLTHWEDVWEPLRNLKTAVADGQNWFVPWDWGNASVLYRTDLVDVEEESWNLLFDERYKGRLASHDAIEGAVIVAALVAGVTDPFDPSDEDVERVGEVLRKQRDLLRFYWTDQTAIEQALASGEVVAAYAWNSSVVALKKQGLPVKYMNPKEGILTWVCGLVMGKDGPGTEQQKYDFLDAMLTPESGKHLIEAYGTGHANRKSFDLVKEERLAELGLTDPQSFLNGGVFFQPIDEAKRQKYVNMFEAVKAGG